MSDVGSKRTTVENERSGSSGLSEALETFRLPGYGALWTSNLAQFVCFHVLFMAMQWLVTSADRSPGRGGDLPSMIQGASIAVASPFAGVVVDRARSGT